MKFSLAKFEAPHVPELLLRISRTGFKIFVFRANLLTFKDFTRNSFKFKDLAGIPPNLLIPLDQGEGGR